MNVNLIEFMSASDIYYTFLEYASEFPIRKITRPAENLSTKLYAPKTNAPELEFLPITSDIKLILVDRTIGWEKPKISYELPMKIEIMYTSQEFF